MEKLLGAAFGGPGGAEGPPSPPSSRAELQAALAGQRRQLLRYQARLQDVVRAYKSLLAEKEALEAGLKALSAPHHQPSQQPEEPLPGPGGPPNQPASGQGRSRRSSSGAPSEEEEEEEGQGSLQGPGQQQEAAQGTSLQPEESEPEETTEEGSGKSSGEASESTAVVLRRLRSQVSTLTAALATVAQEKSRMEASYQADKRQARQEAEEAARAAQEALDRRGAELRAAQVQLAETKSRLAAQQRDRAQEQSDHALMLRELQQLLQNERAQRAEEEEAAAATRHQRGLEEEVKHQAQQQQLRQEEEERLRKKELLHRAVQAESSNSSSKPDDDDPRLQELRAEAETLRGHLQAQLLQEMRKTAHAEDRVQMEEQRVARLEAQVSEMSELLGRYERAKQKDQAALQKLRDRIAQLDLENRTLAMAASGRSPSLDLAVEESDLDANVLKDKMEKLRKLLRGAHKTNPEEEEEGKKEADLGQMEALEAVDGEKATAAYYRQELKEEEEVERYKLRAQGVLKNKSAKDCSLAKELEEAREQLAELREKYVSLRLSCEELAAQHREEREAKKQEAAHLQQLHRQDLERCQLDYQEKVFKLEEEMHKQRDRALAILAEKDQELGQLQAALAYGLPGGPKPHSGRSPGLDGSSSRGQEEVGDGGSLESLTQALRLTPPGEPTYLLYTEQLARKEVEVSSLKKQKHRLEAQLHHLQERLLAEGEQHQEEVSVLQSCLQKVGRDQKRQEGANLEYLKNIFYRFLTLADALGRQQTLTAILTILHFSPEEKQAVLGHSGGGSHSWWHSGKR